MKKILLTILLSLTVLTVGNLNYYAVETVHAQTAGDPDASKYDDFDGIIPSVEGSKNETKDLAKRIRNGSVGLEDIFIIIVKFIDLITKLAGTIAVLILIYGAYQYMLGSISEDKEGAKKTIRYAVMGLVLTFMAYLIVNLVKVQFLGS